MPKAKNPKVDEACALFKQGFKLIEIAKQLDVPEGTVRRWKHTYRWDDDGKKKSERSQKKKSNVRKKCGAPYGNKNASGSHDGAPRGNQNARKYGLFSKYIPAETMELMHMSADTPPIELLWDQIQIAYAAIIRAQKIAFVRDQEDKTTEVISESDSGTMYQVEQAWAKHEGFMKAQARAQSELRNMIKQYDDMLHHDWDLATEEQKARIAMIKAKLQTDDSDEDADDGFIDALNASAREDWSDEEE